MHDPAALLFPVVVTQKATCPSKYSFLMVSLGPRVLLWVPLPIHNEYGLGKRNKPLLCFRDLLLQHNLGYPD